MLIQSQCQKKDDKLSSDLDGLKLNQSEKQVATDGVASAAGDEAKNGEEDVNDDGSVNDDKEEEVDGLEEEEISIDPRTYCKLGHFHLLLEDYAKGML